MNQFIVELKKLNPKCDIKVDSDSNVYVSQDPRLLVLPEGIVTYQDKGSCFFGGSWLTRLPVAPLHDFPLNEKDYFPQIVFETANFENIYELTSLNPIPLIWQYLQKISTVSLTSVKLNSYSSMNTIKYLAYMGLKEEPKFNKMPVNKIYQKELYDYVNRIARQDIYEDPRKIQMGWETFQSWHITGGAKPAENALTHRFYLNISPDKVHLVAKILIEKYLVAGKPFYFKVAEGRATKDSIVIYASHGTLNTTLDILRKIEPVMQSMASDLGSPHPLTYPLAPGIGYASEIMDGRTSYTDVIADALSVPLKDELNTYAKAHKNDTNVHGMSGAEFFGSADVQDKIKRGQLAMQDIMQDKESAKRLLKNIMIQLQKENINLDNIYYDNSVVSDLMKYREYVRNSSFRRGAISVSLIIVFTILSGVFLAIMAL